MTSSSLVRVQVVGAGRRLDVSLPSRVPVWEFLPEVLRGLEWPDRVPAAGLVTLDGTALAADLDLDGQGVGDGAVLTVATPDEHRPSTRHDDLVEAVHDRSRRLLVEWTPEATRGLTGAAALVAGAGVLALLVGVGAPSGTSAILVAGVLVVAASAWSAAAHDGAGRSVVVRTAAAWLAVAAAWVAGGVAAPGLDPSVSPWVPAITALGLGVVLAARAGPAWPLQVPPLVVVAATVVSDGVARLVGVASWQVLVAALAVAVLTAGAVPGLVVEVTVHRAHAQDHGNRGIDPDRLDADVLLAHRIVLALHLTTSGLLVLVSPSAVASGPAASGAVALLVVLRTMRLRHQRSRMLVLAGVAGAGVWMVLAVVAVAVVRSEWVPTAGAVLLAAGAVAVASSQVRSTGAWWAWCADVAEVVVVVAVPLAVTAALWWTVAW